MVAAALWVPLGHAQRLPFTHYTPGSEVRALPSAEVHGVHPDTEGYLWIMIYSSGLVRYDGSSMDLYDEGDGLRDVALWDVVEGPAGRLWVASNGGLAVSRLPLSDYGGLRRIEFTSEWGGTPLLDVGIDRNQVAADAGGRVWVGTDRLGVVRYTLRGPGIEVDTLRLAPPGVEQPPVRTLIVREDGTALAGLDDGRIVSVGGDGTVREVATLGPATESANALYEAPDGTVWVGVRDGSVWRLRGRSLERVVEPLGSQVTSLLVTSRGELMVATAGEGLAVLDLDEGPGAVRRYTQRNGLLGPNVHALSEDAEGNVWVAQSGGLSKLRAGYRAFLGYTASGESPVLPAAAVGAVLPGPVLGCDVWAGTSGGLACIEDGTPASGEALVPDDGLAAANVNALAADEGRLWVGTPRGIQSLAPPEVARPGATSVYAVRVGGRPLRLASFRGPSVYGIETFPLSVRGRDEPVPSVWFAAWRRVVGFVGGRWIQLAEWAGLPQTVFHAVAVDDRGRLWVGTRDQGLYRARRRLTEADRDRWGEIPSIRPDLGVADSADALFERVWSTETGAPTDQIEALEWHEGTMWAATPQGLFALDPTEGGVRVAARLGEAEGLPSVRVFSLDVSPVTGRLWVGTNGGLSEVDPAVRRHVRTLRRQDGLVGNEVWYYGSVRADAQGRVWFGTADGLSRFDPSRAARVRTPPRLHLREAEVVQRASGYSEATFRYAATSFADERAVRYRYRLVGYDEEWSAPTADPTVRYTNLPAFVVPRAYTLEVTAGTPDGPWTDEPLRYTFDVRPPWWLGFWAVLGYAALFGAGVFVVDRVQRRRLVAKERERTRLREAELEAEAARAEQAASEARAQALSAEAERQAVELSKAQELAEAFHRLEETHQNLVETQAQLLQQEKMASLGRLTAGVAHELKNPLNFVTNFARLSAELTEELAEELARLLRDPEAADSDELRGLLSDLRRNAETIETHGRRADEIVRHMLLHSRGTAGPRRPVVFNEIVEDSVRLAEQGRLASDPDSAVEVHLTTEPAGVLVMAAPLELGRVLVNLFDNAYDAVRERAEKEGAGFVPRIDVRTVVEGEHVRVRVADNGAGIPDDVRAQIFEPFFTTKPTGQGTGLGLSLSFDIVRQHGGVLTEAPRPGGGTVFEIALPVASQGAAAPARPADHAA